MPSCSQVTKHCDNMEWHKYPENNHNTSTKRLKMQHTVCTIWPKLSNIRHRKLIFSCARTGERPAKTAHAPLITAHTDSVRNTPPRPIASILPDSRDHMLSFDILMSSEKELKMRFLPSSVGCQRARIFLAPNPEQTVPFDVDDVRRRGNRASDIIEVVGRTNVTSPRMCCVLMQCYAMIARIKVGQNKFRPIYRLISQN